MTKKTTAALKAKAPGPPKAARVPVRREVAELFTRSTSEAGVNWPAVVTGAQCSYIGRTCTKSRKSDASIKLGTCSVLYGADEPHVICPNRFLEESVIFEQARELLVHHDPANEIRLVAEYPIPGGRADYVMFSYTPAGDVADFVAIELQSLDTNASVWPARWRFLTANAPGLEGVHPGSSKDYGINWKMSTKTIGVQLLHKVEALNDVSKKLALVIQKPLWDYMCKEFDFGHVAAGTWRIEDPMHFYVYDVIQDASGVYSMSFLEKHSTDVAGVMRTINKKAAAAVPLQTMLDGLKAAYGRSKALGEKPPALTTEVADESSSELESTEDELDSD